MTTLLAFYLAGFITAKGIVDAEIADSGDHYSSANYSRKMYFLFVIGSWYSVGRAIKIR